MIELSIEDLELIYGGGLGERESFKEEQMVHK